MTRRGAALAGTLLLGVGALVGCSGDESAAPTVTATPDPSESPSATTPTTEATTSPSSPATSPPSSPARPGAPTVVSAIATELAVPWGIAFLPDDTALVTERDTRHVLRVSAEGATDIGTIEEAAPEGEGGVLGIAVSPDFADDHAVFVYVTAAQDNRVLRYTLDGDRLSGGTVILDGIPRGFIHDGGRLLFGPDGNLYVSTGESGQPEIAQDPDSLGGKILRITPDGKPAPGNPDPGSPVWSLGHRNVQGLAFDDDGNLWASEFGDQSWDELNLIRKGGNYGWPLVEGRGGDDRFVEPQVVWPTGDASPSGLAYLDGRLWLGALRGQRLWRVDVAAGKASKPHDFFVGAYGRLRSVAVAPGGLLWVTTSNRDGRGQPAADDDRILVVDPG